MTELNLYVGTYTEPILFGTGEILQGKARGIHRYRLDLTSGRLEETGVTAGVKNPSYLALSPDGRYLYAVNELKEYEGAATGAVSAFAVERDGSLRLLNTQPSGGTDPCHVSVTGDGRYVLAANYSSGSVSVFPVIGDGSLGVRSCFVQHEGTTGPHTERQNGPHAHGVILAPGGHVFVPDLGLDELRLYRLDQKDGQLRSLPGFHTAPGTGPRVARLHPGDRWCYLLGELNSTVTALEWKGDGGFRELQTVSTIGEPGAGDSTGADLHLSPDGRFLYASNRGRDSLVVYRVDNATGLLDYVETVPTRGKTPRNFYIVPSGKLLLAGNQDSDTITVFSVEQATGKLTFLRENEAPTPVCIIAAGGN